MKVTAPAELLVAGSRVAVTPSGKPVTARSTLPVRPSAPFTVIAALTCPLEPRVRLAGEADKLKPDAVILTSILVLPDCFHDLPFTSTSYFPATAAGLALKVRELLVLVTAGLKLAVTPTGRFEAVRVTFSPRAF